MQIIIFYLYICINIFQKKMNDNEKNDIIIQKSLTSSFNRAKISNNKSYNENNKKNLIKEKIYYNINNPSLSDSFDNIDENLNQVVSKILDNITKNSLSSFYDSESEFKNKIDSLNLKFYLETEKYLCNQNKKIKTQTSLFIILFKQIIIYIEEIERLNLIIIHKKYKPENIIKRTDDITQKQKEFQTKEDIINALKKSQSNMEAKLLQALINENNLNKKIEQLQREIEIYKNKIISMNNNAEIHKIKLDKTLSNSFQNDKKYVFYENNNKNRIINNNINNINNNNIIKPNKKKTSHNSMCFTNSSNNHINNIIKINKYINIKSKSPSNFNSKKTPFRLHNIKNINLNIKRNHSEKDNKDKNNNNINNNIINKNNLKKQNFEEIKYMGAIYNENSVTNGKKKKFKKNDKNNTIDIDEIDPDPNNKNRFKKIIITNKSKKLKEENISFRNNKKTNENLNLNLLLSNSNLLNNTNFNKKQKNEFNMNLDTPYEKVYTSYNTFTNNNDKYRVENCFIEPKLTKNGKKGKMDNNINRFNRNILNNNKKSKSLLKKDKNNKNGKKIVNISSSTEIKKESNINLNKKV